MSKDKQAIRPVVLSLYQLLGNKPYLRDIEKLLEKLEGLSTNEIQSLAHLARDLKDSDREINLLKNKNKRGF